MAFKMKENYQKNLTASAKQQVASAANVYINRAITLVNAPITMNNTQQNDQDVESVKGKKSGVIHVSKCPMKTLYFMFFMEYR